MSGKIPKTSMKIRKNSDNSSEELVLLDSSCSRSEHFETNYSICSELVASLCYRFINDKHYLPSPSPLGGSPLVFNRFLYENNC